MLKDIVDHVSEELRRREEVRDKALTAARRMRRLSKQAIQFIHNGRIDDAKNNLKTAENHLADISVSVEEFQGINQYDTVEAAYQEYAEAHILLHIIQNQPSPTPEKLRIPPASYLLGIADIPGELRRQALRIISERKTSRQQRKIWRPWKTSIRNSSEWMKAPS